LQKHGWMLLVLDKMLHKYLNKTLITLNSDARSRNEKYTYSLKCCTNIPMIFVVFWF
jgi:hypothetical protein